MSDDDDRVESFARLLFDAYQDLNGEPRHPWHGSDGTVSEATRHRFRRAADSALDLIEWTRFELETSDGRVEGE